VERGLKREARGTSRKEEKLRWLKMAVRRHCAHSKQDRALFSALTDIHPAAFTLLLLLFPANYWALLEIIEHSLLLKFQTESLTSHFWLDVSVVAISR
jgi:hypothetical protein